MEVTATLWRAAAELINGDACTQVVNGQNLILKALLMTAAKLLVTDSITVTTSKGVLIVLPVPELDCQLIRWELIPMIQDDTEWKPPRYSHFDTGAI